MRQREVGWLIKQRLFLRPSPACCTLKPGRRGEALPCMSPLTEQSGSRISPQQISYVLIHLCQVRQSTLPQTYFGMLSLCGVGSKCLSAPLTSVRVPPNKTRTAARLPPAVRVRPRMLLWRASFFFPITGSDLAKLLRSISNIKKEKNSNFMH